MEEDPARVKVYWAVVEPVVPALLWERGVGSVFEGVAEIYVG